MSFSVVTNCLLIIFIALANGMPQEDEEKSGPLPFLQFTNGGIRVNFGGYHAQAGLGGLLRGTGAGGGLHASAGTPWGAHAGAGLGGQLGLVEDGGNLGGGLYARAGFGRGGPEAAAGLGGRLDGSGRSPNPIAGGMHAGATLGGGPGPGVFLGGGLDKAIDGFISGSTPNEVGSNPPAPAATTPSNEEATTKAKGRTNIQIIRSRKEKEKALEATSRADASADGKTETHNKETRRAVPVAVVPPAAEVGLVKSIYVGAAPAVKTVVAAPAIKPVVIPVVPTAATAIEGAGQVAATATATATGGMTVNPVVVPKPVYPRWYFRKRFWTGPRKAVYVAPTVAVDTQSSPSDIVGGIFLNAMGDGGGTVVAGKAYGGSLFDDIFNIPISTLSAVNQLLNNVG
ncbi:glycine, alanine and asparagine-rich protein [Pogonomyrmex barbatus]|uniref:Glycine, alanine and asparagine-rich protein n=1 Tax=Pogonomyrmex barbatus TaxID=144034 RepID=A0A6I9WHT5_9HYME|nr:glycine, alanine and asparagine-rich protein [Pogonomyrmex barbatus]